MKNLISLIFAILIVANLSAQTTKAEFEKAFSPLVGHVWNVETTFADGSAFTQQKIFEWGIANSYVKTQTYGYLDEAREFWGMRSEGIRAYMPQEQLIMFLDYDYSGELVDGQVQIKGDSIIYSYLYGAQQVVVYDTWVKKSDGVYDFTIAIDQGPGQPLNIVLKAEFVRQEEE